MSEDQDFTPYELNLENEFIEVYDPLTDEYLLTYKDHVYTDVDLVSRQMSFDENNALYDVAGFNEESFPDFDDTIAVVADAARAVETFNEENQDPIFDQDADFVIRPPNPQNSQAQPPRPPRPPQPQPPRPPVVPPSPPRPQPQPPQPQPPRPQPPRPQPPRPNPPQPQPPRPQPPRPQPPTRPQPPRPQPPTRPPNNNRAVRLSADIYRKIKSLQENYRQLINMANRNHRQDLENMLRQLQIIELSALNIYIRLSGSRLPPFSGNIYQPLPRNYCAALRVVIRRLNDLNDDIIELRRIIFMPDIDRQLIIMSAVVNSHISRLNSFTLDCIM